VAGEQQPDLADCDPVLAPVDRDPRRPGVNEHELDVALPARAEGPARRVGHRPDADMCREQGRSNINFRQQEENRSRCSGCV
jgi:hypothetical protein